MLSSIVRVFSTRQVFYNEVPEFAYAAKKSGEVKATTPVAGFSPDSARNDISSHALALSRAEAQAQQKSSSEEPRKGQAREEDSQRTTAGGRKLDKEQQEQVRELEQRDREVRQHEQAHVAAAGGHNRGGPKYEYTSGPDGKRYAVGGHVTMDTSSENTPEATLQKAQTLRRAATAPAEPSGADRAVAAQATAMEAQARRELAEKRQGDEEKVGGASHASESRVPQQARGPYAEAFQFATRGGLLNMMA